MNQVKYLRLHTSPGKRLNLVNLGILFLLFAPLLDRVLQQVLEVKREYCSLVLQISQTSFHSLVLSLCHVLKQAFEGGVENLSTFVVKVSYQFLLAHLAHTVSFFEDSEEPCEHGFLVGYVGFNNFSALVLLVSYVLPQKFHD